MMDAMSRMLQQPHRCSKSTAQILQVSFMCILLMYSCIIHAPKNCITVRALLMLQQLPVQLLSCSKIIVHKLLYYSKILHSRHDSFNHVVLERTTVLQNSNYRML
ncbi:unnamed protein product [Ectocarpus sp. 13 AM-2016]